MAAIVFPGLQSCMESPLVESRIHRLRLPSPKPKPLTSPQSIDLTFKSCFWEPNTKKSHCEENNFKTDTVQNNPNQGGWSFLQALSNVSKESSDKETTYVHPQVKQSSVRLSPKSLELCTENLGNETGTDITDSSIDLFSSDSLECGGGNLGTREQRESWRQLLGSKKKTKPQNFPPPLTTIRGAESLRVRPHREGGRLVIEVTKAPSSSSCFHAERSHGRLRLSFLEIPNPTFDPEEDENEVIEEEFENEMNEQKPVMEEEENKQEEEEKEKREDKTEEKAEAEMECVENWDGEREAYGNVTMRMEKYESGSRRRNRNRNRGRRCKEGEHDNNDLLKTWKESVWVTTS